MLLFYTNNVKINTRIVAFVVGLLGVIIYFAITEFYDRPFHFEWLIGFLAMMGVSITQSWDKK